MSIANKKFISTLSPATSVTGLFLHLHPAFDGTGFSEYKKTTLSVASFTVGCPTWIRTTINAVRVRCPAVRRWGNRQKLV